LPSSAESPFDAPGEPKPTGRLDELAFAQWARLGITPARPCTDGTFVRRAYLDLIGAIPTAREARDFILDRNPAKRAELVDRLLARDEYATYWAMRWGDVLRIKSEFPINLWPNAVQAYHRWVYDALRSNMPYSRFARELLTASGSNFRVPQVNFYRAAQGRDPETLARVVALTFMGTRADRWPRARLAGMAAFFGNVGYKSTGEWKEEIVFFDPRLKQPSLKGAAPQFPDGKAPRPQPGADPRRVFTDWLLAPGNAWFAVAAVNRIWCWVFGRGIVHEADDIRPDNPPASPALLAWLAGEFAARKYGMKQLLRLILTSSTYQLSAVPRGKSPRAAECFAHYSARRLEAEVLIDAVNKVTGSSESYSSPIPEPFTFVPESELTVALADGSITSSFLEMFGRPARDTGAMSERNNRPTAAQRLHMINSSHIQQKLQRSTELQSLIRWSRQPRQTVTELYLTILSRFPTNQEMSAAQAHMGRGGIGRDPGLDLAWALMNGAEFQYRH
jgi:hypothetical protein